MATWVILIVLVLAVSLIVRKLIRDRKIGGGCGCGCSDCGGHCAEHLNKK